MNQKPWIGAGNPRDSYLQLLQYIGVMESGTKPLISPIKIVRELVRAGDAGMPVGEIRNILNIPNSTLSHHLGHLKNVGLIRQEREGTVLRCFIVFEQIDGIVSFLTEECCAADIATCFARSRLLREH